jgi:hypothetical protein
VAIGVFAAVDESAMTVSAIRVPLIQILIEDFADMTVSTSVIVNQPVLIQAQSAMSVNAIRRQQASIVFAGVSGMVIDARLQWMPEPDTPETWSAISDTGETWTPLNDTTETWDAIANTSENWTPIADNSETWQIAA